MRRKPNFFDDDNFERWDDFSDYDVDLDDLAATLDFDVSDLGRNLDLDFDLNDFD